VQPHRITPLSPGDGRRRPGLMTVHVLVGDRVKRLVGFGLRGMEPLQLLGLLVGEGIDLVPDLLGAQQWLFDSRTLPQPAAIQQLVNRE
jgi:hypothetical protein